MTTAGRQRTWSTIGAQLERDRARARESRLTVVMEILKERAATYERAGEAVPAGLQHALADFARERAELRRRLRR